MPFWHLIGLVAFIAAPFAVYAQGVDTVVEVPTAKHGAALVEIPTSQTAAGTDQDLTVATEYKTTKNVIEQQKETCWNWYADFGYWSEYNFRGTDLTPNSDGSVFLNADVSRWGFTLGLFVVHQLGTAHSPSFSISEGGGGGSFHIGSFSNIPLLFPETIQDKFNEIDVFLQYRREFGPINVTVGDIGFFIDRNAQTFLHLPFDFTLPNFPFGIGSAGTYGPFRTVGDEEFDRVFIRLATDRIPYIEPWLTFYQTVYSEGQDVFHHKAFKQGPNPFAYFVFYNSFERNPEHYGGYLEGRLRGHFSLGTWADVNPFGVISYSFGDRSEPVTDPANFAEVIRGRPLRGFNVAQVGLEVPIHLLHVVGTSSGPCAPPDLRVNLVPFGTYSYHISDPTPGTDRNEWWGGAKIAVTF